MTALCGPQCLFAFATNAIMDLTLAVVLFAVVLVFRMRFIAENAHRWRKIVMVAQRKFQFGQLGPRGMISRNANLVHIFGETPDVP